MNCLYDPFIIIEVMGLMKEALEAENLKPYLMAQPLGYRTPGVNFTNILRAAFTRADPKSAKKTVKLSSFIALLGSARVKAARRTLVKLTPDYTGFCNRNRDRILQIFIGVIIHRYIWYPYRNTCLFSESVVPRPGECTVLWYDIEFLYDLCLSAF